MTRVFKQSLALITLALLLSACGKKEDTAATSAAPAAAPAAAKAAAAKAAVPGDLGEIEADGMPVLAKKSNCAACHAIDKKMLGPSWTEVATKYKAQGYYEFAGKKYPVEEGLILKVSKGGAGVWGTMPMPANAPAIKDDDIKALVHFVVGLAK
jgi:cytochrome c